MHSYQTVFNSVIPLRSTQNAGQKINLFLRKLSVYLAQDAGVKQDDKPVI